MDRWRMSLIYIVFCVGLACSFLYLSSSLSTLSRHVLSVRLSQQIVTCTVTTWSCRSSDTSIVEWGGTRKCIWVRGMWYMRDMELMDQHSVTFNIGSNVSDLSDTLFCGDGVIGFTTTWLVRSILEYKWITMYDIHINPNSVWLSGQNDMMLIACHRAYVCCLL